MADQKPNQQSAKKQKKKSNKVRARLPRGLQDRDAADLRAQGS
jgi:hypothetical protein